MARQESPAGIMIRSFLIELCAAHRARLLFAGILMLAETAATLAIPWLGGIFAKQVFAGSSSGAILLVLLAVFGLQAFLRYFSRYAASEIAYRIFSSLRLRVYEHLQALPLSFFNDRRRGDVLALLTGDCTRVAFFVTGTLLNAIPTAIMLTGTLVFMYRLDWLLTLVIALAVPAFYLLLKIIGRRIRPLAHEIQNEDARFLAMAEENFAVLPVIKSFTREPAEFARFELQSERLLTLNLEQEKVHAALEPAVQFVAAAAAILVLWLAATSRTGTALNSGEMVSFLLYAALLTRPVASLASVYGQTQSAQGALTRIENVLGEIREPLTPPGISVPRFRGAIEFSDVTFAYPGRPNTLDQATVFVNAGETVAITGPNGAGKSTFAHLLLRLYAPQSGRILIDGTDIAAMNLVELRQNIGLVSQRVLLFNASVRDNISIGKEKVAIDEIVAAAQNAEAHEFIMRLPQGYDTIIGDSGVRLSGGQRQRLALARALIKNPSILVLDEATAMFDPDGEKSFIERAKPLIGDCTVILITHRPASLALAERVLKLEHGQFIQADSST